MLWACLAMRILSNPLSNVFQKLLTAAGTGPLFVIGMVHGMLAILCLPLLAFCPTLPASFWLIMLGSALLTVAGNVLIVAALQRADLSVLGPINSYKAIVSLLPGMLLLGEFPPYGSLTGIALIVAGSWFLGDGDSETRGWWQVLRQRGVQLRFAALVLSALEAVVMKRAMQMGTATSTFAAWSIFGFIVAAVAVAVVHPRAEIARQIRLMRRKTGSCLALMLTTGLMQACTIVLFYAFDVGAALALFQLSTIVSVLLGWQVFRERNAGRRLLGACVMVVGAVMIIVMGK